MDTSTLSLSGDFADANEADWLALVEKALKGGGIERITRKTADGISIRPLYRETDFPSASDPLGAPGRAPFLRGASEQPDPYLPWDIRQRFTHPRPEVTNSEILRDLERGVSSIELAVECTGQRGVQLCTLDDFERALDGVQANIAPVALDHMGAGTGASAAALLALWAEKQSDPKAQRLAFNIDPLTTLTRMGRLGGGLDAVFEKNAALIQALSLNFPLARIVRIDARPVHEAGGTEAQELAALMANGVDTLRRLDACGLAPGQVAARTVFTISVDANYGLGIAKIRAARRLWARIQEALGLNLTPMRLQVVSSARMLTRYDAWVNMLRGTAACFAGAAGGADIITVRPFNEALGMPEELGRRIARNTQIMAMEESGLGRVADPSGGAWFTETLADDLSAAAWKEFQTIESEGGYAASLMSGALQGRVRTARDALMEQISHRKIPITGVSEFPLIDEIEAPVGDVHDVRPKDGVDGAGLHAFIPRLTELRGKDALAERLTPIRLAEPFEVLRHASDAALSIKGKRPAIFIATLGPVSEHTARADFARNLFAAGGVAAKEAPVPPKSVSELAAAFKASGCKLAVLCGSDARYGEEAESAAKALKTAGLDLLWLAGKYEADSIDRHIYMGCDVVHELTMALTELGAI